MHPKSVLDEPTSQVRDVQYMIINDNYYYLTVVVKAIINIDFIFLNLLED